MCCSMLALASCSFDVSPYEAVETNYTIVDVSDTEYYGIPRIFIDTEKHQLIIDRTTEIPAKMRIYGEDTTQFEEYSLTIRGRGNTSWGAPKKNYKIELDNKAPLLGMPQNKDWVLIPNYADKTLLKNSLAFLLSEKLGVYYTPRSDFVELYLNGEYVGVYLLCEKIKQGANRIDLPSDSLSFIVEIDYKAREGEVVVNSNQDIPFRIHYPKNPSDEAITRLTDHINLMEHNLRLITKDSVVDIEKWIDVDAYIKHFWIQELFKNPDATFFSSVYFTWTVHEPVKMGPVWDFDLSAGGHTNKAVISPTEWLTIDFYWNKYLFYDTSFKARAFNYWKENVAIFKSLLDDLEEARNKIKKAAEHNFYRWNVMGLEDNASFNKAYKIYDEAVDDLKQWLESRINWISAQMP